MSWVPVLTSFQQQRATIALWGGAKAIARQHVKNRLTARERSRGDLRGPTRWSRRWPPPTSPPSSTSTPP